MLVVRNDGEGFRLGVKVVKLHWWGRYDLCVGQHVIVFYGGVRLRREKRFVAWFGCFVGEGRSG